MTTMQSNFRSPEALMLKHKTLGVGFSIIPPSQCYYLKIVDRGVLRSRDALAGLDLFDAFSR